MTIDLDAFARSLIGGPPLTLSAATCRELLRLARLGQQREREKCGTCALYGRCRHKPYRSSAGKDWHCADWEEA